MTSIRALPSEGMVPAFEVGLRIIDPKRKDLHLEGIVYTISLEGTNSSRNRERLPGHRGLYTGRRHPDPSVQVLSGPPGQQTDAFPDPP